MATKNIVPRATGEGSLGTADKKWAGVYANEVTVNGTALTSKLASVDSSIGGKVDTSTYNTKMTSIDSSISELSSGKVSVSGGTYTSNLVIKRDVNNGTVDILGGADANSANISLIGKDDANYGGNFIITAHNSTQGTDLVGAPNGTLTWGGKNIATIEAFTNINCWSGAEHLALNSSCVIGNYVNINATIVLDMALINESSVFYIASKKYSGILHFIGSNGTYGIVYQSYDEAGNTVYKIRALNASIVPAGAEIYITGCVKKV